ncbi:hypothetical protein Pdw03_6844 [Penicillium digitatum]|uniref:Retrovirus-related Pol polyprotein from transposon TNT 1-94-like beta-barrel domain-containing protein n=1 Tax=Penicillium digitatum TaxID=36651 RepID=A0A7T6XKQ5_PENDI|nr:hypothetical protein Pdw03_6844 [Penicillium digitatum]
MQASYNIEDFTINSHEIDISSAVPKLKGQSNFRDWETALYIALAANNRYYTYMISNGIPIPKIPEYQDSSPEAVRNLLIEEAQDLAGDHTTTVVISVAEIRDRVKQVIESNIVLRKEYNLKCTNWDLCNSRANLLLRGTLSPEPFSHIAQNTDVRDSFKKLRATYAVTSHQHSFARYTKWTDLRFKNGTASEFVRKFQETLRDLTSIDGKINSVYVLCQFKKAINENPKCYAFLQNLRVDEKDVNLMDQVYAEFLEVDIHNRSMNPSYNANSTTVQTSSSSHNDKKKDTKKGGNDKQSNSNNSSSNNNNKDKPSKKKTDFVREENVILCRHHGTLGNHYSNKCPLLKNSANATTIQQPQQQPLFQQVAVPQPGQIIGQVDNQGRILSLPQQQPRQGANAIFAPASYPTVPQKGPPSGDPLARYNNLFTNVLFAGIQANAVHGSHIVSKEGLLANDNNDVTRWMIDSGTSTHMTPHRSVFVNFRRCVLPVSTATGDVFYTEGYGDVILHLLDQDSSGKMAPLTLQKVWLAPDLRSSLISMSALDKADIGTWTKNGMMTFKHQDFYGPESTIGFATCEGEHYWLNCAGIDKIDHMIDCNLVTGSPNSVFATQREIIPISIDLAHRRACHAGEERVRKMEIFADGVKLKKGAGVTFPCAPCIKGDNYVVYNVRTKKIERSRNVIFNENPSPASLPDPAYDLNITGMNQEHEHDSQDRHIPIDFLRPHLENPFNIRSTSPPSPTVEDDPEDQTRAPNALDPSNPALFEEDLAWSNDEMAGSFGRCVVEQRVDTGAHFEAGGRGVLVEPQPVSRQVVNMDIPLETTIDLSQEDPLQDDEYHDQSPLQHDQVTFEHNFSRLDPVPDDRSRDQSYVQPIQPIQPETGQLRRSTRIKNPSRAYIESLASKSFFDSNVLRLLAEQPEILISLFANATSNEHYVLCRERQMASRCSQRTTSSSC